MSSTIHNTDAPSRWSGLKTRAISGVIAAVIALTALWLGGFVFNVLVIAAGLQMIREWDTITEDEPSYWKLGGVLYIALPCASIIWLRSIFTPTAPNAGAFIVLYILFVVWATDIGAYFAGRRIGGPKLAPSISPNKTWAGLGGGALAAAIVGGFMSFLTPYPPSFIAAADIAFLLAILAQGGDLFESWLKRRAGLKDSGSLIPGHGGLLDRVDGLMFTVPVFAFFTYMAGHVL